MRIILSSLLFPLLVSACQNRINPDADFALCNDNGSETININKKKAIGGGVDDYGFKVQTCSNA
jgi:hypothetical protein